MDVAPANAQPTTWTVDDDGPANFSSIQEAINAADSGDTVYVYDGTYYEHLIVTTNELTITGEDANITIIDGSGVTKPVVSIDTSNNVKLSGFTIQNGFEGIEVFNSTGTVIHGNVIKNNTYSGVVLDSSNGNNITANRIIFNSVRGIEFSRSTDNSVSNNFISEDDSGIGLYDGSTDNLIFENTISHNEYVGVDFHASNNSVIYHNNFIENTPQTYPQGGNVWDNGYPSGGNHWSDFSGVDVMSGPDQDQPGSDGLGDTPYVIDADNRDRYPLVTMHIIDVTPPNIENVSQFPLKDDVYPGETVEVNASVTDDMSGVKQVTLNYTGDGAVWNAVSMMNVQGNVWNASIPSFPFGTNVSYVISAEDNVGNTISTEDYGYVYEYQVIPEFSWLTVTIIFGVSLTAALIYRKKRFMPSGH